MQGRRHEEVARPRRAGRGQNRRLELAEALLGHAPADAGDDVAAQRDVALHLLAAQIEKAVAQPDLLAVILLGVDLERRSEEHTSELQSLMRISYAVFCLKKKKK